MTANYQLLESRSRTAYASFLGIPETAVNPDSLATIITIIQTLLPTLLGLCTGAGTPPTTGGAAIAENCQNGGTIEVRAQIRRACNEDGLEPGMSRLVVIRTVAFVGAGSTGAEIEQAAAEAA